MPGLFCSPNENVTRWQIKNYGWKIQEPLQLRSVTGQLQNTALPRRFKVSKLWTHTRNSFCYQRKMASGRNVFRVEILWVGRTSSLPPSAAFPLQAPQPHPPSWVPDACLPGPTCNMCGEREPLAEKQFNSWEWISATSVAQWEETQAHMRT